MTTFFVRNQKYTETNIVPSKDNMAVSAQRYIDVFTEEYPNAYITKIRWQLVEGETITYIIDGIEKNTKYSVKYVNSSNDESVENPISVLGKVERELAGYEIKNNKPTEKPLKPEEYLAEAKIHEIAKSNYDTTLQEWKVIWSNGKEYIQMIFWGEEYIRSYLIIDPRTGEIFKKY